MGLRGPAPKRREDKVGHPQHTQEPVDEIEFDGERHTLEPGLAWTEPARYADKG